MPLTGWMQGQIEPQPSLISAVRSVLLSPGRIDHPRCILIKAYIYFAGANASKPI